MIETTRHMLFLATLHLIPSHLISYLLILEYVLELNDARVGLQDPQAGHLLPYVLCLQVALQGRGEG